MAVIKKLDGNIIYEDENKNEKELVKYCLEAKIPLNEANLQNLDLSGLDFSDAFIDSANFKNTKLNDIRTKNTSFLNCDFTNASLNDCNFLRTDLEGSVFDNVNIRDCIVDMKNIFSIVLDTYVMSFTKTHLNLGCNSKSIQEWRNISSDELEDEEQKWLWNYYKDMIFEIIDKRLGV